METVRASTSWHPETGVYCLFAEPPAARFTADPIPGAPLATILVELDEDEHETGRIAGVEIVGFLDFDRWKALPDFPLDWQIDESQPLALIPLLRREQSRLRESVDTRV